MRYLLNTPVPPNHPELWQKLAFRTHIPTNDITTEPDSCNVNPQHPTFADGILEKRHHNIGYYFRHYYM